MSPLVVDQDNFCLLKVTESKLTKGLAKELISLVVESTKPMIVFDLSGVKEIETDSLSLIVAGLESNNTKLVYVGPQFIASFLHKEGLQRKFISYSEIEEPITESNSISEEEFQRYYKLFLATLEDEICRVFNRYIDQKFKLIDTIQTYEFPEPEVEFCASVELCTAPFLGSMIMGFNQDSFMPLIGAIFSKPDMKVTETRGGVAELVNITLAKLRAVLNDKGFGIEMRPPIVIREPGTTKNKALWSSNPSTFLTFSNGKNEFYVEVITRARG